MMIVVTAMAMATVTATSTATESVTRIGHQNQALTEPPSASP